MGNTFEEVKARSKELARKRELSENEEFIARAACMNKVFSVLNEVKATSIFTCRVAIENLFAYCGEKVINILIHLRV